jgi:hypothetical protein
MNNGEQFFNTAAGGYTISRSLRFNSADSAYLNRTPASAGNRKTWTWAGWVKRSSSTSAGGTQLYQTLFESTGATSPNTRTSFMFNGDQLDFFTDNASSSRLVTSQVFRDFSAWFHVVLSVDTTQGTASNRVRIYINGVQVTAFTTATYPTQNLDTAVNTTTEHRIGKPYDNFYFHGYLADIHFIDGQALDPTSFGEFSATTGVWVPKAYTGSYGTNGFRLTFADNSAATATTLGKDAAGSNNWTPNNLSVTAGAGNDSLIDVPVNGSEVDTGAGGQVRGNYCTMNPLDAGSGVTYTNGNLDTPNNAANAIGRGTIAVSSGKWYFEYTFNSVSGYPHVGLSTVNNPPTDPYVGASASSWGCRMQGDPSTTFAVKRNNGSQVTMGSSGSAIGVGDVLMVAYDLDSSKMWFGKNGSWFDSGNPATGANAAFTNLSGTLAPASSNYGTGSFNFGQRPFAYTAPSGFKALNTANLPAPTITQPSTVMDVKLYTGNGGTQTISGLGFSPDLVWIKSRSNPASFFFHHLRDTIRGATKVLYSNDTRAEDTDSAFTSFNSDGFTLASDLSQSAIPYAAWAWDAGSSTVTNTAGSISSQVRANASAGFSVVTYTGTGANATVGHGLGIAPGMVIVKRRDTAANWQVRHTSIAAASSIQLNLTNASASATTVWNSTAPSSTVFSVGTDATVNASGATYVAYCFAPVAGYSAFGSYTGNGSADGSFGYTGFRVRWLLVKNTTTAGTSWAIFDSARGTYNVVGNVLLAQSDSSELSGTYVDFLSNGFKLRVSSDLSLNNNGNTYIYAAFAESPFQYARAR